MVRKTTAPAKARTTPAKDEVKTPEADAAAAAKVAPAADKDTQGAEEAASTAQSPTAPPAEIAQAPAAGGEELSSGGTVPAPEADSAAEPVEPSDQAQPPVAEAELISPEAAAALAHSPIAAALEQNEEPASPVRLLTVICLRSEGRRRADRRWPEGETVLPLDELTPRQIATLEADPLFIVKRPAD